MRYHTDRRANCRFALSHEPRNVLAHAMFIHSSNESVATRLRLTWATHDIANHGEISRREKCLPDGWEHERQRIVEPLYPH